jgi:hypothetical protein
MSRLTRTAVCIACRAGWQIQSSGFGPGGSPHKELGFVVPHFGSGSFRTPLASLSYRGDGRQDDLGRDCGKIHYPDSGTIGRCIHPGYGLPTSISTNVMVLRDAGSMALVPAEGRSATSVSAGRTR